MRNNVDIMLFSFKEEIFNLSITEDDRKLLDLLFVLNKDTDNMISNFRFLLINPLNNFVFLVNFMNSLKNHQIYLLVFSTYFLKDMAPLKD